MRRFIIGLLIIVGVLSLLVASTSLWTRRQVINTEVFVSNAQQVVATPAVQARVTSQVVDSLMTNPQIQQAVDEVVAVLPPRIQAFRPTIADGVRNILSSGVQTLLTSEAFSALTAAALTSAQTQLVNGESVRFTLGQAKARIAADQRTGLAGQVLNLIPDDLGVTVVSKQDAPQLYTAVDLLKSAWLWVGLLALAALIGALVLSRNRRRTLRAFAVTAGVAGLLLALGLTLARSPLLANVKPVNVSAADAIYQQVSSSLIGWTLWLVAIMAVIVVVTLLWGKIGIIPGIARGYRAAKEQASQYRASRATAKQSAAQGGVPDQPDLPWTTRVAAGTTAFIDGLDLPDRLAALSTLISRNLRAARWSGVVVGAVILLIWPSPTLSVLILVAALVALYLGLLEFVMAVGGRAELDPSGTTVATAATGPPEAGNAALAHAPAAPGVEEPETVDTETLSTMGDRLDLIDRLASAHSAGLLTDAEFEHSKAQVLGVSPA